MTTEASSVNASGVQSEVKQVDPKLRFGSRSIYNSRDARPAGPLHIKADVLNSFGATMMTCSEDVLVESMSRNSSRTETRDRPILKLAQIAQIPKCGVLPVEQEIIDVEIASFSVARFKRLMFVNINGKRSCIG